MGTLPRSFEMPESSATHLRKQWQLLSARGEVVGVRRHSVCFREILYCQSLIIMPLFGEVVEPVSRALYIDESSDDEETQDMSTSKIADIEWVDDNPGSIDTLLIFDGHLATDFLLRILEGTNTKSAAHLKEKLLHRGRKIAIRELNILLYRLSGGIFGCLCPSVDIVDSNNVLDKLLPVLGTCKQIVVVTTVPAPFYRGNDPTLDLPPAFMRMLYSSTFKKDPIAPLLESPNIVTGVPASILSWCEIFKKPGCLYVCYSDSEHLDSISAEPLVNVFSNVFEGLLKPDVLSFKAAAHESSSLYL